MGRLDQEMPHYQAQRSQGGKIPTQATQMNHGDWAGQWNRVIANPFPFWNMFGIPPPPPATLYKKRRKKKARKSRNGHSESESSSSDSESRSSSSSESSSRSSGEESSRSRSQSEDDGSSSRSSGPVHSARRPAPRPRRPSATHTSRQPIIPKGKPNAKKKAAPLPGPSYFSKRMAGGLIDSRASPSSSPTPTTPHGGTPTHASAGLATGAQQGRGGYVHPQNTAAWAGGPAGGHHNNHNFPTSHAPVVSPGASHGGLGFGFGSGSGVGPGQSPGQGPGTGRIPAATNGPLTQQPPFVPGGRRGSLSSGSGGGVHGSSTTHANGNERGTGPSGGGAALRTRTPKGPGSATAARAVPRATTRPPEAQPSHELHFRNRSSTPSSRFRTTPNTVRSATKTTAPQVVSQSGPSRSIQSLMSAIHTLQDELRHKATYDTTSSIQKTSALRLDLGFRPEDSQFSNKDIKEMSQMLSDLLVRTEQELTDLRSSLSHRPHADAIPAPPSFSYTAAPPAPSYSAHSTLSSCNSNLPAHTPTMAQPIGSLPPRTLGVPGALVSPGASGVLPPPPPQLPPTHQQPMMFEPGSPVLPVPSPALPAEEVVPSQVPDVDSAISNPVLTKARQLLSEMKKRDRKG